MPGVHTDGRERRNSPTFIVEQIFHIPLLEIDVKVDKEG